MLFGEFACHSAFGGAMAIVYFFVAFGFLIKTFVDNNYINRTQGVFFAHLPVSNVDASKLLFYERPDIMCVGIALMYMCIAASHIPGYNFDSPINAVMDAIGVSSLLALLVHVVDLMQGLLMVGMYVTFYLLVLWSDKFRSADIPVATRRMILYVECFTLTIFWFVVFAMMFMIQNGNVPALFFASTTVLLDAWFIYRRMRSSSEDTPLVVMMQSLLRNCNRFMLLICVFTQSV